MVHIVVFGAAGTAGRTIVDEADGRGHAVTAVYRNTAPGTSDQVVAVRGDVTDSASVREILATANPEVIVIAVGGSGRDLYRAAAKTVAAAVADLPTSPRIVHFGGGASLTTPDGTRFVDLPGFPGEYLDPAIGQAAALDFYRDGISARWTYFSPPPVEFFEGPRLGIYRTGTDQPVTDENGHARLSYADAAVAIVDELESPEYDCARFTAGY